MYGDPEYPVCTEAFSGEDEALNYEFMSVLSHSQGRSVVSELPENVCGFDSEMFGYGATPWDKPLDWPTSPMSAGRNKLTWNIAWGRHYSDTEEFRYWITKPDFQFEVGKPLAWSDLEEEPFCVLKYDDANPDANPDVVARKETTQFDTYCTVPPRTGRQVIYAEWGRNYYTYERFHNCVDVTFNDDAGAAPPEPPAKPEPVAEVYEPEPAEQPAAEVYEPEPEAEVAEPESAEQPEAEVAEPEIVEQPEAPAVASEPDADAELVTADAGDMAAEAAEPEAPVDAPFALAEDNEGQNDKEPVDGSSEAAADAAADGQSEADTAAASDDQAADTQAGSTPVTDEEPESTLAPPAPPADEDDDDASETGTAPESAEQSAPESDSPAPAPDMDDESADSADTTAETPAADTETTTASPATVDAPAPPAETDAPAIPQTTPPQPQAEPAVVARIITEPAGDTFVGTGAMSLSAARSSGENLSYRWSFDANNADLYTLNNATSADATLLLSNPETAGTVLISLNVSGPQGSDSTVFALQHEPMASDTPEREDLGPVTDVSRTLQVGDRVSVRLVLDSGEDVFHPAEPLQITEANRQAADWPYALALAVNEATDDITLGVTDPNGRIDPAADPVANRFYAVKSAGITSAFLIVTPANAPVAADQPAAEVPDDDDASTSQAAAETSAPDEPTATPADTGSVTPDTSVTTSSSSTTDDTDGDLETADADLAALEQAQLESASSSEPMAEPGSGDSDDGDNGESGSTHSVSVTGAMGPAYLLLLGLSAIGLRWRRQTMPRRR